MDNLVSRLQESTAAKKGKSNKKKKNNNKPIKVVYISNPIEVKTSASKFRALVQELTGQDAEFPHDPTKFSTDEEISGGNQTVPVALEKCTDDDDQAQQEVPKEEEPPPPPPSPDHHDKISFENFDDVFSAQMLENFTGCFPPDHLL